MACDCFHYMGKSAGGFTLLEMLFTLAIAAICLGIAVPNLKELSDPLDNGTTSLVSYLRQVRATAISTTSAYTVSATSSTRIQASYSATCSDVTTTPDTRLVFDLPTGATLNDTEWSVCFSSRGLADGNPEIPIVDRAGSQKSVKIYIGGGVRIL